MHSLTKQIVVLFFFSLAFSLPQLHAQESDDVSHRPCNSEIISSVPSRPTVSNGADTTQCGVLEVEYGFDHEWVDTGSHFDDLSGGLRLGLTHRLDLHWASTSFLHLVSGGSAETGFGDTWLGLKYRFHDQSRRFPALGVFYQVKAPTASENKGLGTGQVDHSLSLLVSKDVSKVHFDFNVFPMFAGRVAQSGFDHNVGLALSGSFPLWHSLSCVAEGYGYSTLNQDNPAFASSMIAFTYQVNPRLILDTGLDVGVTHYAPNARFFVGITYAISNVYAWLRHGN